MVSLLKELDSARNRNAWYATELDLARKSGYVPNPTLSPTLDSRIAAESFDDEDKPLVEALLSMRAELAKVQESVDKQMEVAAQQVAQAERQRDAAVREAVYAKAKLAAHVGGSASSTPQLDNDRDVEERSNELSRKLANALNSQKDLRAQVDRASTELAAERRARQLADDTANAAQKRMAELENFKQQKSSELERIKAELHMAQREARDQSVAAAEAAAALQMLRVEKDEIHTQYRDAVGSSKENNDTFESLREAMAATAEMKSLLERKLDEERAQREKVESKLNKLKTEHEARTAELVSATQRLRDAEELAERHASEARTHRQAVLAGLDKISSSRDVSKSGNADADRIAALQGQVTAANALVKRYQQEANTAADRLRGAEERIAGLEAYQEQASREGVTIRRQLQNAIREAQSLQTVNAELKHQIANQQLETNAVTVQHNTLKDLLSERGISPTAAVRVRGSPRDSPDLVRVRDLEQQLSAAMTAHEEMKQALSAQANESEVAYRDKLTQLENDYQSAVHYVKGTEKMLKQLKDQLSRYKTENTKLKTELIEMEEKGAEQLTAPPGWESERTGFVKKVDSLQDELKAAQTQLEQQLQYLRKEMDEAKRERDAALKSGQEAGARLTASRQGLDQLQQENSLLEQRALDAERKVQLLLDQVEHSVDSYRRRSRQVASMNSDQLKEAGIPSANTNGSSSNGGAVGSAPAVGSQQHRRIESNDSGSVYGTLGEARNSAALDSLANELETLRSQWEATNKNYRLSTNFDFDTSMASPAIMATAPSGGAVRKDGKDDEPGAGGGGLSESLADWRKRLDS